MNRKKYVELLKSGLQKEYSIAKNARSKGIDPSDSVEIKLAKDVASRVEGIIGVDGITNHIRALESNGLSREEIAFEMCKKIARGEVFSGTTEELLDKAVRVGVGILTEGVLVAPTEGISKISVRENPDGSSYVAVYYAGPIRSAGGTVSGLSVLLADIARREVGISDFRPTETEIERYVEEINLYEARVTHLQYKPPDEHIRTIIRNCPICIHGDPTEDVEVSVHRNLERMETNRIRGGVPLVVCEGLALKAAKISKYAKKLNLSDWEWIDSIVKTKVSKGFVDVKPDWTYLEGLVAGRPVFGYPSMPGGFRLRYGRCRTSGLMTKSIHPAAMSLLDDFLAYGTQVKVERPGKGGVITTCDSIEPPVVLLKNGEVRKVLSYSEGKSVRHDIKKILFLGDMLCAYGDFLKSNHPLVPPGYCEEWWEAEAEELGIKERPSTPREAFEISKSYGIPLHPSFLFFWDSITKEDLKSLSESLPSSYWKSEHLYIPISAKPVLEKILCEHIVDGDFCVVSQKDGISIFLTLFGAEHPHTEKLLGIMEKEGSVLDILSLSSGARIKAKGRTYIGARMGRPEKAKERRMDGSPNGLFPTGSEKNRSIMKMYKDAIEKGRRPVVEVALFLCEECRNRSFSRRCDSCGSKCERLNFCKQCGSSGFMEKHCGRKTSPYSKTDIDIVSRLDKIRESLGRMPEDVKGVKGLSSGEKIPEPLEKAFIRALHRVYVFRDGTVRFDSTDVPLTHFKPNEIGLSVEQAKALGYEYDYLGNPLERSDQLVPLMPQDIILSEEGGDYFVKVCNAIDDMLVHIYHLPAYYNVSKKEDLIGKLFLGLSPHTSAAVLCRLIGFTKAKVGYAHPFFHTAKRRNADGDEDSVMLLLDALLNFSRKYLSDKRGGTMDSPIVINSVILVEEVDDEAFDMEATYSYGSEFYRLCENCSMPGKANVKKVKDLLGTEEVYGNLGFTRMASEIDLANTRSAYITLGSIPEKIEREFSLAERLSSVDVKDMAKRLILSHFIPDIYGNLRSYSRQSFRCVDCNEIYRRVPLSGRCRRCRGNLTLTIHKGGIEKYLNISLDLCRKYSLENYMVQRLELVREEIRSIFEDDRVQQTGLDAFI